MKVAVFGCGFVGGTVADFLESKGNTVYRVDPVKYPENNPLDAVIQCDGIVIAVPTPMGDDGKCDDSIVRQVLDLTDYRHHILLKSTVTYDNVKDYPPQLVYNPECLIHHLELDQSEHRLKSLGFLIITKYYSMSYSK